MIRKLISKIAPHSNTAARAALADLASADWAIDDPARIEAILEEATAYLAAGVTEKSVNTSERHPMTLEDGVATINVSGVMMKRVPWVLEFMGVEATSTSLIRDAVAAAADSDDVKAIALVLDTPGGQVDGIASLNHEIRRAGEKKPTVAHATDRAQSAGFWVGSSAQKFTAGPGAQLGSIGVYRVIRDSSRAMENAGIKTHVIRSGQHKGVGEMGAPVTDAQLKPLQEQVEAIADNFVASVAMGRGLTAETVRELADGRSFDAETALSAGLIDDITHDPTIEVPDDSGQPQQASVLDASQGDDNMSKEATGSVDVQALTEQIKADLAAELKPQLAALAADKAEAEARAEKAEAEAKAQSEALASVTEAAKAEAIAAGVAAGKITPAMVESTEAYGSVVTVDQLKAHIEALPVQARPAAGGTPAQAQIGDPDTALTMKAFPHLKSDDLALVEDFRAVGMDGTVFKINGEEA